ncbi:hypothetical protein LJ739_13605 [Aestuariibacter halophilus]|uniref:Uncharacterized protein n=1 Tax=Fluctibacter halophilus TaxID=226011 RepID=A0ABS8GA11_9ALTE|nr:hypothetical protein [Aestuariibacter halophilus]MCC2617284.1 hypothetical protein [Aestuariibacter halophilus]
MPHTKNAFIRTASLSLVCAIPLFLSAVSHASEPSTANSLRLQTSVEDVNGVRDIEAGNLNDGLRKTLATLSRTTVASQRQPLLNNLCATYIALEQLSSAHSACDAAVSSGSRNAVALNNRAVLNCKVGNAKQCVDDLKQAQRLRKVDEVIAANLSLAQQTILIAAQ